MAELPDNVNLLLADMRTRNAEADRITRMCANLTSKDPEMRRASVQSLDQLSATSLVTVRPRILALLCDDPDLWVRKAAAALFLLLPVAALVDILPQLLSKLEDSNKFVRTAIMGAAAFASAGPS